MHRRMRCRRIRIRPQEKQSSRKRLRLAAKRKVAALQFASIQNANNPEVTSSMICFISG